jgi:hypothetical protein
MNTKSKMVLALVAGAALGAAATQGLHAQAKLKAYSVSELDITDVKAQEAYLPSARKAIADAHGRPLRTAAGFRLRSRASMGSEHLDGGHKLPAHTLRSVSLWFLPPAEGTPGQVLPPGQDGIVVFCADNCEQFHLCSRSV